MERYKVDEEDLLNLAAINLNDSIVFKWSQSPKPNMLRITKCLRLGTTRCSNCYLFDKEDDESCMIKFKSYNNPRCDFGKDYTRPCLSIEDVHEYYFNWEIK